jgi:hypothetical protein
MSLAQQPPSRDRVRLCVRTPTQCIVDQHVHCICHHLKVHTTGMYPFTSTSTTGTLSTRCAHTDQRCFTSHSYIVAFTHSLSNVLDLKKLFDCFVDVSSGRARVAVMLEHPAVQKDAAMKDALWTAVKTSSAAAATAKANAAAAAAAAGGTALKPSSSSNTGSSSSYAGSYGSGTQLSLKLCELMAAVFTYAKDEELRRMQHAVDIARLLERVRERLIDEACHLEVATSSTDILHGQAQHQQQQQHRVRHPSALSSTTSARAAGSSSSSARPHSAHHKGASTGAAADANATASAAVVTPRAGAAWYNGEALLNKKGHAIHLPLSAMQDIAQVSCCM